MVVGVFADPVAALLVTPALSADVALLDIELGSSVSGVEVGIGLRRSLPRLGIVLLSNYTRPQLLAALPADVAGGWSYLSKRTVSDVDALSRAIRGAAEGLVVFDAALTASSVIRAGSPIERLSSLSARLSRSSAQGYSNRAIGERLVLTEKSVENHITRIYQEVGIDAHDPVNHQRCSDGTSLPGIHHRCFSVQPGMSPKRSWLGLRLLYWLLVLLIGALIGVTLAHTTQHSTGNGATLDRQAAAACVTFDEWLKTGGLDKTRHDALLSVVPPNFPRNTPRSART